MGGTWFIDFTHPASPEPSGHQTSVVHEDDKLLLVIKITAELKLENSLMLPFLSENLTRYGFASRQPSQKVLVPLLTILRPFRLVFK